VGKVTRSGPKKFEDEGLRLEGPSELSGFLGYRTGVAFGLVLDKQRCQWNNPACTPVFPLCEGWL